MIYACDMCFSCNMHGTRSMCVCFMLNMHVIMAYSVYLVSRCGMHNVCVCLVGCVVCVVCIGLHEHAQACVGRRFLGAKVRYFCGWGKERPPSNESYQFLLLGLRPGHTALSKQCTSISCLPHPPRGQ